MGDAECAAACRSSRRARRRRARRYARCCKASTSRSSAGAHVHPRRERRRQEHAAARAARLDRADARHRDVGRRSTIARRRGQAMVFQRPVLLRRSAAGNVRHALKLAGVRGASAQRRIEHALAHVGLAALAERPARVLSGGEQQRLALARRVGARARRAVSRRADGEPRSRRRRARWRRSSTTSMRSARRSS